MIRFWLAACVFAVAGWFGLATAKAGEGNLSAAAPGDGVIYVGGAGSGLGVMAHLADAYMAKNPHVNVRILSSGLGSSGGIAAVIGGDLDIAIASRPLRGEEATAGVVAHRLAATPLVLVAYRDTTLDTLSEVQLADIFNGSMTRWPDGSRLRLVMRPQDEASLRILRSYSPRVAMAVDKMFSRNDIFLTVDDVENAAALERIRGSFGLATLGQIRAEQRELKVLGFEAGPSSLEAYRSGAYPFGVTLYLVTRDYARPPVGRFQEFVHSREGARILERLSYLTGDAIPAISDM